MERLNNLNIEDHENPFVNDFLDEVIEICRKYNLCIGHEDIGGCFEVEILTEDTIQWLWQARDCTLSQNK